MYTCLCFLQTDGIFNFTETTGAGKCPYDPRHNSTFVYVGKSLHGMPTTLLQKAAKEEKFDSSLYWPLSCLLCFKNKLK